MADVYEFRILAAEARILTERSVATVLEGKTFQSNKVGDWTRSISEGVLRNMRGLSHNFKYVVTCVILQRTGAGMEVATSCYWDPKTDSAVGVEWSNKTISCALTVFATAI